MIDEKRLSDKAVKTIQQAQTVRVSPISIFEIVQKVRLDKWPEMKPFAPKLADQIVAQGAISAPFSEDVAYASAALDWQHRDPFDRILAATAMLSGMTLISADVMFDTLEDPRLTRLW